ncbi:DUF624 domain-containing protein [Brachybacterium sp. FME24]|uniref:DUF624 domain-containing protein n=1 Tax=Brachybacterium sp. FME24 TaxID=2742605 RepID=UPI0018685E7F|nr:DUF624 domain-containing protein [Brachybacterium sp. FME24]
MTLTGARPSAAGGIMVVLAWVPRLVAVHLTWVVLVLMGAVVGGVAPATATLVALLHGDEDLGRATGPSALAVAVLRRFRRELVAANRAAGPFVVIALAAGLNVALAAAGALPGWFFPAGFAASVVLLVIATLAGFHAIALHVLRPSAPASTLWRGALAGVVLLPIATASWAITLAATLLISVIVQPVALACGGGILVAVTTIVLVRTWQSRLDDALPSGAGR